MTKLKLLDGDEEEGRRPRVQLVSSYPGGSLLAWEIGGPVLGNRNNQARLELESVLWVLLLFVCFAV